MRCIVVDIMIGRVVTYSTGRIVKYMIDRLVKYMIGYSVESYRDIKNSIVSSR